MLGKYYVGHEVVLKKKFIKYMYNCDHFGCHYNYYYLMSREVVLLRRDNNGNYLYLKDGKQCVVIDPNNLVSSIATLGCNNCGFQSCDSISCKSTLNLNIPDETVGVVGIRTVASFDKNAIWTNGFSLIDRYNEKVQEEAQARIRDIYEYVDDDKYPGFIREIDDDIMKLQYDNKGVKRKTKIIENSEKVQN